MLFNSGVFLNFFAAFLLLYWLVRENLRLRNLLIVLASYLFYGWWDYRFLSLLFITSLIDFAVGLAITREAAPSRRKAWLILSLAVNLTVLGFFKYYDFFVTSLAELLTRLDVPFQLRTLRIILPVGISFYTFQSMSYAIDVYRGHIPATRSLLNFLAFVSFFPQLVAGPIERAAHLLPQFERTLTVTRAMLAQGWWLMLWGMFKKVALADNFAPLADMVFDRPAGFTGPMVIAGTLAFALQIYCDFSGYSDIARGTARWLGFDIMLNFNIPYAARNVREFWRRWHISLSTWLRDYLYISLGGNRRGPVRTYVNLALTMLLGGLWHGAAWHFVLWGAWHGMGLATYRAFGENRRPGSRPGAGWFRLSAWAVTMLFVLYGWLLFRAPTTQAIWSMTLALGNWTAPAWLGSHLVDLAAFSAPLVIIELWQCRAGNELVTLSLPPWARATLEGALLIVIMLFWQRAHEPFIYFQF